LLDKWKGNSRCAVFSNEHTILGCIIPANLGVEKSWTARKFSKG
jgi:hypothetical protein